MLKKNRYFNVKESQRKRIKEITHTAYRETGRILNFYALQKSVNRKLMNISLWKELKLIWLPTREKTPLLGPKRGQHTLRNQGGNASFHAHNAFLEWYNNCQEIELFVEIELQLNLIMSFYYYMIVMYIIFNNMFYSCVNSLILWLGSFFIVEKFFNYIEKCIRKFVLNYIDFANKLVIEMCTAIIFQKYLNKILFCFSNYF